MRFKLSQEAKADLRRIYRYGFFEFGEDQADKYFAAFFERFEQIAENPYISPSVDHIYDGYRRNVCGVHSIYYKIGNEDVEIIRVLGRQNPETAL